MTDKKQVIPNGAETETICTELTNIEDTAVGNPLPDPVTTEGNADLIAIASPSDTPPANVSSPKTVSAKILELYEELIDGFYLDAVNEPFVSIKNGESKKIIHCRSLQFNYWFKSKYEEKFKTIPSDAEVRKAIGYAEFRAVNEGESVQSNNRVARINDAIYYDLFADGRAIKITSSGFKTMANEEIVFKNDINVGRQVNPASGGDGNNHLDLIFKYINVKDEDEASKYLLKVAIISSLVPDMPHPLLVFHGPSGSGKSTASRVIKNLIDPARDGRGLLALPTSQKNMGSSIINNYLTVFDNADRLHVWQSDLLCRAVSGGETTRKKVQGIDGEIVISSNHCIVLNGINQVINRSDLLDRSLLFGLERFGREEFKDEASLWKSFETDRPQILDSMFKVLSGAMAKYQEIPPIELKRMADFTKWGYAIAEVMGIGGDTFLKHYEANIGIANNEAIDNNPVAAAVIELMRGSEEYDKTMSDFYEDLGKKAAIAGVDKNSKAWPKAANQVKKHLNAVKNNLESLGISFVFGRSTAAATKNCNTIKISNTCEVIPKVDNSGQADSGFPAAIANDEGAVETRDV